MNRDTRRSSHRRRSRSPNSKPHNRPSSSSSSRSRSRSSSNNSGFSGASSKVQTHNNDINRLQAKILKARLTKSSDLADLEKQLASATSQSTAPLPQASPMAPSPSGTIVLPQVDSHGRLTRVSGEVTGKGGDMASIAEMAKEERQGCGGDSVDRALAKGIMRDGGFQNDLEYMDDNAEKLAGTQDKTTGSNKKQKQDREKEREREEQRQKQAAVRDYRVMDSILSHCTLCFKQSEQPDGSTLLTAPAHPIIALGNQVYLALPDREPMNDGHCIIAPIEHTAGSSLRCDDDVWDEIGNFMKSLIRMFAEKNQAVVFMETVIWTEPARARHCFLECIPMPVGKAQDAPAFFREAMVEAAEEWSQHRKVIDTLVRESGGGGFRNTMTAKMPYFHVWFNPKGGMAHVIENAEAFPEWFGREVVAGMLDLPPAVYRKPRRIRESQSQRRERAEEWKAQFAWDRFDWTKMLSQ